MKVPIYLMTLFFSMLLPIPSLPAQTVTTSPVGYNMGKVNANSDQQIGLSFLRAASFVGEVDFLDTNTLNVKGTLGDLTTEPHFILVTSGTLSGQWFEIASNTASSLNVNENVESLGMLGGDTFEARPFWTFDTLFPNGGNIPKQSNVFAPSSFIFTNDKTLEGINFTPSSSYFYYDGSTNPFGLVEGWHSGIIPSGDIIIPPDTYITIRNASSSEINVVFAGDVPSDIVGNTILSRSSGPQDNLVSNPYPLGLKLSEASFRESGSEIIRSSGNIFAPEGDLILLLPENSTGLNPTAVKTYFYYDGTANPFGLVEGWHTGITPSDDDEIAASGAFIIRRRSGEDELLKWNPPLPYAL